MGYIEQRSKYSFRLTTEGEYVNGKRNKVRKPIKITDESLLKKPKKLEKFLEQELLKFEIEVQAGAYITPEKMVFSKLVDEWLEKKAAQTLAITRFDLVKRHLQNHIVPALGDKEIGKITSKKLYDFMYSLTLDGARKDGKKGGLGDKTRKDIYSTLKSIFYTATSEWSVIPENPMEGLTPPKIEKKEMGFYDSDEAALCISKLYELEPIWWRMYFLTTLIAGTRRGEGLALEWKDVEWDRSGLNISRSLSKTVDSKAHIKSTKNKKSRFISMPEWYMEDLHKYYLWWRKEKMKQGEEWEGGEHEYLFHSGNGQPFYYTTPTARWRKFRSKAGLKTIRLHDLRHTMVTLLIEAGAQMKAIQKRTGHESLKVLSDTYSHVTEKVDKDMAEKFDVFKPAR